jgi:hypothetical protein
VLGLLGEWVLESYKGFGDIVGHGEVDSLFVIVPIKMDSTEDFAVTVDGEIVVFSKAVDEVIGVGLANNFDTEIVNDKIESGGSGDVTEESWSVACGDISRIGEMFYKFDVG